MKFSSLLYYGCVSVYGCMMAVLGYNITTWPFWVGLFLIIASNIAGKEYDKEELK